MAGWTVTRGRVVALPEANIDTDQLIPARFMSTPRDKGYGEFLLYDARRTPDGDLRPDFPLNRFEEARILVTRRNFGSGSSREAAVYALVDAGIRVVAAPSFGDIFAANAVNNGLLPARLSETDTERLLAALPDRAGEGEADLATGVLSVDGIAAPFTLDPIWKVKLQNGWDDIDLTKQLHPEIENFRAGHMARPGSLPIHR